MNGLHCNNADYVSLTLDSQQTWILGCAVNVVAHEVGAMGIFLWDLFDGANNQVIMNITNDGLLHAYVVGGGYLASSVQALATGTWYYIEFKARIANAGGLLEIRVNGNVWATFSGDTQGAGGASANILRLGASEGGGAGAQIRIDDVYILDGTGAAPNNDYLGDSVVQALLPSAPGTYTQLATLFGAATHREAVDEAVPDEDTTYVDDSVVDVIDSFNFANLTPVSANINGVQVVTRAKKTDAGAASFARFARSGGADYQGADVALSTSYAYYREILALNPNTGLAWTLDEVNAAEFGFKVR